MLEWMGLNSYYYDGLQPKMSAGMIKLQNSILILQKDKKSIQYFLRRFRDFSKELGSKNDYF